MNKRETDKAIQEYLDNGGAVTVLRLATEKDQRRSRTMQYHNDKALAGSERSKKIIETHKNNETSFIFSKNERWSE
jgi:hypothetical protein